MKEIADANGIAGQRLLLWCPRCGSVVFRYEKGGDDWETPKLVERASTLCEVALDLVAEFTSFHDETENCREVEQAESVVYECCLLSDEPDPIPEHIRDSDRPMGV